MRKGVYLFIALLLPACIFIFLKFFGKNEFAVEPLFVESVPLTGPDCPVLTSPYAVPDSVMQDYPLMSDSLLLLYLGDSGIESIKQFNRVTQNIKGYPVLNISVDRDDAKKYFRKKCIFLLADPADVVLIDRKSQIRGQYSSSDREDMDRLITEITILLKKY